MSNYVMLKDLKKKTTGVSATHQIFSNFGATQNSYSFASP